MYEYYVSFSVYDQSVVCAVAINWRSLIITVQSGRGLFYLMVPAPFDAYRFYQSDCEKDLRARIDVAVGVSHKARILPIASREFESSHF